MVSDLALKRNSRLPVPMSVECAHLEARLAVGMAFQLEIQPLEPLPAFLRAASRSIMENVTLHFPPTHPDDASHHVIDHRERHDASVNGVADRFQNQPNG